MTSTRGPLSRRSFLASTAVATTALAVGGCSTSGAPAKPPKLASANGKLNLGVIGVAGRGGENLKGVSDENIVALCDVDSQRLAAALEKHPKAATYSDFRKLLERTDLDAVVVSTPDHCHAVVTVAALQSGRHVYCEKPLTHTVSEVRRVAEIAKRTGRITQMGNQIHSGNNYRRVVEIVQSGALGDVREVHHWVDGAMDVRPRPTADPIPPHLNWDLWLGPVEPREYSDQYVPFNWRRWWHFGGGTLSDFCCHHIDLGVWALQLGLPTRIETEGPPIDAECAPAWLVVHYDFPARKAAQWGNHGPADLPPVKLHWYHGGKRPPQFAQGLLPKWGNGTLFVGSKGLLLADYDKHRLFPEKDFADFKAPPAWIPNSPGHHEEWIRAIKGGAPNNSPFAYGAQLTEIGLLGNVAFRAGQALEWDASGMRAKNCPAADAFLKHHYREGWKI